MRYLDPVALAKLRNLSLDLRRVAAEGHLTGRHRSSARGLSHEFAEHRAYVPGDEMKALDWKVFARQERFYVRQYQSENILTGTVLLDASGSMAYAAGGRPAKWETACRLAMASAYLILAEGDAVGLATFDAQPREFLTPRASFGQLGVLDSLLERSRPGGETDLSAALEGAASRIRRRSLVVLISDLLGDPEAVLGTVKALQARRHELMVLQVLDPAERDFGFDGPTLFRCLEDRRELFCDASALQEAYRRAFQRQQRLYEAGCHGSSISFTSLFTDRPWEEGLARFLGGRRT
ncbi:MAG: DUF58 domain-containing protein [Elusimicrobia bacterium]|nr:DUF58 domain-containing protein [Elusimicrobiota bacterium]